MYVGSRDEIVECYLNVISIKVINCRYGVNSNFEIGNRVKFRFFVLYRSDIGLGGDDGRVNLGYY